MKYFTPPHNNPNSEFINNESCYTGWGLLLGFIYLVKNKPSWGKIKGVVYYKLKNNENR